MELHINRRPVQVSDDPNQLLLWVLRDELGLTGTKFGCGAGICGACTVHVDGSAVRACVTTVAQVAGREIRTIEGLAEEVGLHPVQQAFIDLQVPQCGWCMSGQIMAAAAFLDANPAPTVAQLQDALQGIYCRCGCYVRIRQAVAQAATQMAVRSTGHGEEDV